MKKRRFISIFAVVFAVICLTSCYSDAERMEHTSVENQQITVTEQGDITNTETETIETTTLMTTSEKLTEYNTEEFSEEIALSREYEFNLEEYIERRDKSSWRVRDELGFLSDEQYDAYIRAWIFIDEKEYFIIPDTCKIPTHYIDENGEQRDFYIEFVGYAEYYYISTYQSFYEYLQSVFTQEAVDEIMSDKRFKIIDDELYFAYGERGGPIDSQVGRYELTEASDDELTFEYIVNHTHDEKEWVTSHTIKLIHTDDGWRSELFDYLKA